MSDATKPTLRSKVTLLPAFLLISCVLCPDTTAEESQAEIAKKLNNPIADLISVPFQFNYDKDLGPTEKGERYLSLLIIRSC